jgi:hypothetical protein
MKYLKKRLFYYALFIGVFAISCKKDKVKIEVNPQKYEIIDLASSNYILERVHLDFGDNIVKRVLDFGLYQDHFIVNADGKMQTYNRAGILDTTILALDLIERDELLNEKKLFVLAPTCDTIRQRVDEDSSEIKYIVDFGSFAFNTNGLAFNSDYDKLQYLNILDNRERYATLISNLYEDKDHLYFTYHFGYARNFICIYNKFKQSVKSYLLADMSREENIMIKLMRVYEKDIYVLIQIPYINGFNPVICRLRIEN